jgi:hypothetical protein
MKAPLAVLLSCSIFLTACATVPRVAVLPGPGTPTEESPYEGETIYLRSFVVKNKSNVDGAEKIAGLKRQYMDYVRQLGKFKEVVDATASGKVPADAPAMSLDLQLQLQDDNFSLIKAYYAIFLLYSVWPRKGTATVIGNSTVTRGGRMISSKSWTSSRDYAYTFYGGARTGPIQDAFRDAYDDVFTHLAVPLRMEGGPGISKAELQSMVKQSLKEAAKSDEKVYNSDVDKPTYKSAAEDANAFALVIGIEKYQQVAQADFGERDAQIVREHLLAMGFPPRNIVHLSGSLATKSNLEKYLESWLPEKVKPESKVFVYFSGHGAPDVDSKQAYLVPWDGDTKFLSKTGYPVKKLYADLIALKARRVTVALDSCFSGAGGRSILPKGARPLVARVDEGASSAGKLVVMTASEADEISLSDDQQGHGLFTYYLLKGLNDKSGKISAKGLYDFLLPRVQDGARSQNRDQTPKLIAADETLASEGL